MNKRLAELPDSLLRNIVRDSEFQMAHCSAGDDWSGRFRWEVRRDEYRAELQRRAADPSVQQMRSLILAATEELDALTERIALMKETLRNHEDLLGARDAER